MKKASILLLGLLFILAPAAFAQELNCSVIINAEKVQTQERTIFKTMQNAFSEFVNSRKWTDDAFEEGERIECTIYMTLLSGNVPDGTYSGTVQIQAVRPVYNTSYETITLNYLDKSLAFNYRPSQPLYFNENSFLSNITSILAYYAYIIIGVDYDSYSSLGGTPYFEKARTILNAALYSGSGWDDSQSNGRYWLQQNYNNQVLKPFRVGFYKYHRLALDNFEQNPDSSRVIIVDYLKTMEQINAIKPFTLIMKSFFMAKSEELINIFSKGDRKVREDAVALLKELDPLNSEKYLKCLQN